MTLYVLFDFSHPKKMKDIRGIYTTKEEAHATAAENQCIVVQMESDTLYPPHEAKEWELN